MTIKKESYPQIGKKVMLDLELHQRSSFLMASFQVNAINNGWTELEVKTVFEFLVGKPYDQQIEILSHYCISPRFDESDITIIDVKYMLDHLGLHNHYLGSKPLDLWDEYDRSNYYSLERKATTRLVRKYAFYDDTVEEQHKYDVASPPSRFYTSYKEAQEQLSEKELQTTHIYALWISE